MAAIEQVDTDDFPFGLAARALVRAVAGDVGRRAAPTPSAVEADARRQLLRPRPRPPRPACSPPAGPATRSRSRHWLEQLSALASSVGDVVFVAIAQVLTDRPATTANGDESSPLAPGWRRIVDSVVVG